MRWDLRVFLCFVLFGLAAALIELCPLRVNTVAILKLRNSVPGEYRVSVTYHGESTPHEVGRQALIQNNGPEELFIEIPARDKMMIAIAGPNRDGNIQIEGVRLVKLFRHIELGLQDVSQNIYAMQDTAPLGLSDGVLAFKITGQNPVLSFRDPTFSSFNVVGKKYLFPAFLLLILFFYIVSGISFTKWWKYRELVWNITRMNLTLKYRGSFLGFLWSLLNPIIMIFIYSVAFSFIIRIQIGNYLLFLLTGLLPFNFISMSVATSTTSIIGNAPLLKKVSFPRESFPISTSLFCYFQFLLSLLAFVPFILIWKPDLEIINLLFIVPMLLLLLFAIGVSLILSSLTVVYRDIQHFTEIGLIALFWVTPVVYNFELIPPAYRWIFLLNPGTVFVNSFHDLLYSNRFPDVVCILGIVFWPLFTLAIGNWVFNRLSPKFAEVL